MGWVVNATYRPLYLRETDTVPIVQAAWWVPRPVWRDVKISPPPGFVAIPTELSRQLTALYTATRTELHSLHYISHFTNTWIWRTWRVSWIPRHEGAFCYRFRPVLMAVLDPTSWLAVWTAIIVLSFLFSKGYKSALLQPLAAGFTSLGLLTDNL